MCGLRAVGVDVREGVPEEVSARKGCQSGYGGSEDGGYGIPRKSEDHARPQEHNTGDRATVLTVLQRASTVCRQQLLCPRGVRAGHVCALTRDDVCVR
jgi:hypothetical protein